MNIIAIAGKAGSGKSSVASILVADYGFVEVALADPMKRFVREIFDFSVEQLWGPSEKRNAPDLRYKTTQPPSLGGYENMRWDVPEYLSPRVVLQKLGTEFGRKLFEDVWIDQALRDIRFILEEPGGGYDSCHGAFRSTKFSEEGGVELDTGEPVPGVVISDARFPNELDKIRAVGGRVWCRSSAGTLKGSTATHISETSLDYTNFKYDAEIPWQNEVTDLHAAVARLMETSK